MKTFIILTLIGSVLTIYAETGKTIKTFKTPGNYPTGCTFDGKNIWIADNKDDKLYCIDINDGKIIKSLESPAYWPTGLAWDGKFLWNIDIKGGIPLAENYNAKVYKIDPTDGTILHVVTAPANVAEGLTFDGKYLWCTDTHNDMLIQFDPNDGTTIKSIKAPYFDPRGLCFDGKYLWVSDRISDKIYMIDPESGCVIITFDAPGQFARGLCYDGENIWNVDYQDKQIYQIERKGKEKFYAFDYKEGIMTYTHLSTNFGPGTVKNLDVHLAIPTDRPTQKINSEISFYPENPDIITDKWGLKTAHYRIENIKADDKFEAIMKVNITTNSIRYYIFPEEVGSLNDIPKDITDTYLVDDEKYQINHPIIQKVVKEIKSTETNPYWIARKLYNYLIDNMYYEMAGGWNTAPTVLERGNGSCSEYSFVYISLCRAAGIPARYVGSVVMRGDDRSMDDVFHRWVEIYLPNYGWVPVDPSGGDQNYPADQAKYFGSLSNRFCITTQSGGGSETMEWTYNSNDFYQSEPKTNIVIEYFGDWEPVE
ncbi:MAG: hypothetical protein Kow0068_16280 [Marinilabiliales bacterium]